MAQLTTTTTTNDDLNTSEFHFHEKTFGINIRIENNGTKAVRHTSFDHGTDFDHCSIDIHFKFYRMF